MEPSIQDGEKVVFEKFIQQKISIGNVVLCSHPFMKKRVIVKRVKEVLDNHMIVIQGDNPLYSSDSRSFGPIEINKIIGILKE
tara:strand:- start:367 stop:615 length:249 start_codon:yes stop_codon:yes gene_type:complete